MLHFFLIGVSALIFRRFQPDHFWIETPRQLPPFDQEFRDQGSGIPQTRIGHEVGWSNLFGPGATETHVVVTIHRRVPAAEGRARER